jgi:hypothetical protein
MVKDILLEVLVELNFFSTPDYEKVGFGMPSVRPPACLPVLMYGSAPR